LKYRIILQVEKWFHLIIKEQIKEDGLKKGNRGALTPPSQLIASFSLCI